MESIPAGIGTHQHEQISLALRLRCNKFICICYSQTESIYQGITRVTICEKYFSPDIRYSKAVAITGDTPNDAVEKVPVMRFFKRAEAEGIEQSDRASTHSKYIPDNTPHSCCCTLVWFNG